MARSMWWLLALGLAVGLAGCRDDERPRECEPGEPVACGVFPDDCRICGGVTYYCDDDGRLVETHCDPGPPDGGPPDASAPDAPPVDATPDAPTAAVCADPPPGGCDDVVASVDECPSYDSLCAGVCGATHECCSCADQAGAPTWSIHFTDCPPCADGGSPVGP